MLQKDKPDCNGICIQKHRFALLMLYFEVSAGSNFAEVVKARQYWPWLQGPGSSSEHHDQSQQLVGLSNEPAFSELTIRWRSVPPCITLASAAKITA